VNHTTTALYRPLVPSLRRRGRTFFRRIRWMGSSFIILAAASAGAAQDAGWNVEIFSKPAESLKKSDAPWPLMERFLEAGERDAVENYLKGLSLPKQADAAWRTQSLLDMYAGSYPSAWTAIQQVSDRDSWTVQQRAYLEGLLAAATDFIETPSDHFLLRARPQDAFLGQYVMKSLESAYSKMSEIFGIKASSRVVVEIYPDEDRFSVASTLGADTLERSGAIGICKFRRLMILSPQAMPLGYRWLDALAHEYNHYIINQISGSLCPLWMHEGVARYYETAWRRTGPFEHPAAAENQLAEAALAESTTNQKLISFARMEPSMVYLNNQEEVSLAFSEVSDAIGYLVDRFGPEKLVLLLANFKKFPRAEAFEKALGVSEEEFEAAWRDSLKDRQWKTSKGAMAQKIRLKPVDEMEFVGVDAQGHLRLGDRLRQEDQPAAALVQYKKALEQEPDNGVILVKAARMYLATENGKKAEESLKHAIAKNAAYVTPYVMLGEYYYEDGRYEEAQQLLQEALEINPFHPKVHELLGLVALDVGNFSAARKSLEQCLALNPNNNEVRQALKSMPKDGK